MKNFTLSLAVLFTLAAPVVVEADTVYVQKPGGWGMQAITGTIVSETGTAVTIETEDGQRFLIRKADIIEIVRPRPSESPRTAEPVITPVITPIDGNSAVEVEIDGNSIVDKELWPEHHRRWGLVGGMNISNMSTDPQSLEDDGSLSSYALGLWWRRPMNGRLALDVEALYSVKGDAESGDGYTVSTRLGYLEVSACPRMALLPGAKIQPWLAIGPSLGIRVSARSTLEGDQSDVDVEVKDQVRAIEPALVLGGGFEVGIRSRTYGIGVRYSRGLTNLAEETANGSAHNSVISILAELGSR